MRLGNFHFSNPNDIHKREQISVRYTNQYIFFRRRNKENTTYLRIKVHTYFAKFHTFFPQM